MIDGDAALREAEARLYEEARDIMPPSFKDWTELVAKLLWAREMDRLGIATPGLAPGMSAVEYAQRAVVTFFLATPDLVSHDAVAPLARLQAAIGDLADGRVSPMFEPAERGRGRPAKGRVDGAIEGNAARVMDELMARGWASDAAAGAVAKELRDGRVIGCSGIKADKVRRWRDRIRERLAEPEPDHAVLHYLADLPAGLGVDDLLRMVRHMGERMQREPAA